MVKEMLSVLMDGIKDTNMLINYYEECEAPADQWFLEHAANRMSQVESDYKYVCNQIGLETKARGGDEIAEALQSHLYEQIHELKSRLA